MKLFSSIIKDAKFPNDFHIGPASETIGMFTGGSSGDWINTYTGVPAGEVELGTWDQISAKDGWMPVSSETAFDVARESWGWLEPSFRKIGN